MHDGIAKRKRKKERNRRNKTEDFPQINFRPQTPDTGSSENIQPDKCQKKNQTNKQQPYIRHIIFRLQKITVRKNSCEKETERTRERKGSWRGLYGEGEKRDDKKNWGDVTAEKREGHRKERRNKDVGKKTTWERQFKMS